MPARRHRAEGRCGRCSAGDLDLANIRSKCVRIEREERVRFDAMAPGKGVERTVDSFAPFTRTVEATYMNGSAFTEAVLRGSDIARDDGGNEALDCLLRVLCGRYDLPRDHHGEQTDRQRTRSACNQPHGAPPEPEPRRGNDRGSTQQQQPARMFSDPQQFLQSIGIGCCTVSQSVSVNFSAPIALFPLPGVCLLPHTALPLHIFEPRYRQMVACALEHVARGKQPLPIAIASIEPSASASMSSDAPMDRRNPPLRKVVCVGHIVQHQERDDGRYDIVLQGLCRAAIDRLDEPTPARWYRQAMLHPIENPQRRVRGLGRVRSEMRSMLSGMRMQRLHAARTIVDWIERPELSNEVALELVAFAMVRDESLRYQLLAEHDAMERAKLIWGDLCRMDKFIAKAEAQTTRLPPRGTNWN